ncbi:MAG TPA: DUF1254 domain-containing protein [Candidatus Acidoferrum sp.]|nr:DUF1254 domain-containing protein [Candidatus Acidoferrum sp.]
MSRTDAKSPRSFGEEAIERICVNAYPLLVSEAYARLLASRAIDPLARAGRPATLANAEGASLECRAAWLHVKTPEIHLQTVPCNDYHVCTLLDAELQPFASIGTRSAGGARQELVLLSPSSTNSTSHHAQGIRCPSELIAVLTHHVRFGRESTASNGSPFRIEDQNGKALVDLEGPVETLDAVAHVEALRPEQYFSEALGVLHEMPGIAAANVVTAGVQKSFATIASSARASAPSKGWASIDHRLRDRTPEGHAASVHAGYFPAESHDILEVVTRCDESGTALDGARTYRMRFERWNEPPSHASWFLYVAPAAPGRVNLVRAEPAMTIMLGPRPTNGQGENWIRTLPAPTPLEVRLILCWPTERARSEIWAPPAIVAV